MVGSEESIEYIAELPVSEEIKTIPLTVFCFTENINLSTIWIPSSLLQNRNEPQNTQVTRGIFHTLEKRDSSKHNENFSVYATSDEEIFHSDEEDLLNLNIDCQNTIECLKKRSSDNILAEHSHASCSKQDKFLDTQKKTSLNQKKGKQKKMKKNVGLDKFLSDYTPQDLQDACCQDYFNRILAKSTDTDVHLKSVSDFPELAPNEIKFIHPEKSSPVNSLSSLKSCIRIVNTAEETKDLITNKSDEISEGMPNESEAIEKGSSSTSVESVKKYGKLVIENIPGQTREDDVQFLLCSYGEIKSFSLERVGKFLKATVEINEEYDIDWIIECLHGSEAFGASTCKLKCYEQP